MCMCMCLCVHARIICEISHVHFGSTHCTTRHSGYSGEDRLQATPQRHPPARPWRSVSISGPLKALAPFTQPKTKQYLTVVWALPMSIRSDWFLMDSFVRAVALVCQWGGRACRHVHMCIHASMHTNLHTRLLTCTCLHSCLLTCLHIALPPFAQNDPGQIPTKASDALASHLLVFSAEQARRENRVVELEG